MLFQLLCGHAISDFALQSETMGLGKGRHKKPPYFLASFIPGSIFKKPETVTGNTVS